jgi:pimeloyl-ACP methyl ester carboxylesterase
MSERRSSEDDEAEAVLFIHSTGTGPMLWAGVPESALGGRRRLLPANIGYAPNAPVERDQRLTAGDDAGEVARAVPAEIERIHLVAHSYGALVGLHLIPSLASRLASVFFFEPVVFGALARSTDADAEAVAHARSFLAHPWFLHDEERGGREAWLEMFIDYWNRPGSWAKMPVALRDQSLALGWKMFQEVRACFFDETPFEAWDLPVPTTIAYGKHTTIGSRAMSHGLAAARSNVSLVEIEGVGHMAPLTHPARVHQELSRHLARASEEAR